jgi:mannosyltransferase
MMTLNRSRSLFLLLALMVVMLSAAVRFHRLDAQSLWNDEGNAYVQSTRTFFEIADNAARDIHPPGYYMVLAVWRLLFGETAFALRSLSVFAGVLTVAFTFALGKRLFHPLAGLCAALFVALNTFNLYYSQEMRMYALLGLWSVGAIWAFVRFIQTGAWRWGIALALLNAAGLYTHYAYPAVMVTQGVLFVLWWVSILFPTLNPSPQSREGLVQDKPLQFGRFLRSGSRVVSSSLLLYILANLLTLTLYLPWLPTAIRQITTWPNTGVSIETEEALQVVFGWFALGITYDAAGTSSAIIFFLLFGLIILPSMARYRQGARGEWWRMLVPVLWVVVTVGGFLLMGLFREANLKFLLPAQIGFALWMGRGVWVLWTLKPRRTAPIFRYAPQLAAAVGAFSIAAALWTGLDPLYHASEFQRDDYRGIVQMIKANAKPDDAVILNAPGQIEVFRYYYGDGGNVYPLPIGLTVDTETTQAAVREIIDRYGRIYAVLWGTEERDPQNIVENMLDTEAYEIDNVWYRNVRLARYGASEMMGEWVESGERFGEHITLERFKVSAGARDEVLTAVTPGDVLQLEVEWTTDAPLPFDYKVFFQLISTDGVLITQRDSMPRGDTYPTSRWQAGEIVVDRHALGIPDDLPPSHYSLIIGFYNPANSGERLPVIMRNSDYLVLGDIVVERGD